MVRNCIVIYFLLFFALPALALETDQYLSWQVELQDSRPAVNDYVNSKMLAKLERSSVQQANSCHLAARRIIRVFRRPFFQIIEQWAETSPAVEVYPSRNFAGSYRNESIYIKNVFPFILPMARTMNINGVYLGTDKLGHFISFGVRYFGIFHRAIERGADERTAMERVVQFGLMSEVDLVGKIVTGVLSFADLEANFQGMLFFRSLCDEKSSFHLEKNSSQQWRLVGKFDIARYVNGDWDESYNESGFSRARWTGAIGLNQTLKKYCDVRNSSRIVKRFEHYQTHFTQSFSQQMILDLENHGTLQHRAHYNFHNACSFSSAASATP